MRIQFNILKKLGLTDVQVKIYLVCLEFGGLTTGQITEKIKEPRSTINDSIKKLVSIGYISTFSQGKRTLYIPTAIDDIAIIQDKKAREVKELGSMLRKHSLDFQEIQQHSFVVPHVKYYEGNDVTEIIYNHIYSSRTYYAFFNGEQVLSHAKRYDDKIVSHLVEQKIPHKFLLVDNPSGRTLLQEYMTLGLNGRLLPGDISFPTDNIILDNKFLYISYTENRITAIEIKDEIFVKTQRAIFDTAWLSATALQK